LTFFPEREEDAQFAPDGQSFVFISKHGGDGLFKLYTMLTSGGNAVRLTRSRAEEHTPRFSPDGRWIAYTRNDPGEPRPAVWKVSALGGQESLLVADAALPDWSHDSNEIIFVRTQPSGEVTLMRRSLATGEERRVLGWTGSFDMPRWSPDGSSVAFISSYSVWVVPVKGGEPRRLTEGDVQVQTLTWTPDSRALICDADWGGKPNLWMVPLDGGPPVPITSGSGFDIYPAISCDWKSLLYTNERWQRVLWRVEAEGRHPQVIQTKTTFQTISIDSTGRYVAFSDSEASEPHIRPAEHELGVLDLETLDERRLGPGAFPGFSPDGGRLAFFRKDKAGNRLWVVELSTGASRRLAQSTSLEVPPAWSPNGAKIVFSGAGGKGNTGLTILDVAGGREVLLVEGRYKAPAWSPDGLWIAATGVGSEGKGLYVVDAKNGRTRLFSATASYEAAPIWAADSQSIQVLVNERTQPALVTLGLDGSEASPRLELEFTPDPGFWGIFEVHRLPGKGWVYVLQRAEGDIYLIEFASARQPD
jgi:TolB protein